jgi:hypothetical protein
LTHPNQDGRDSTQPVTSGIDLRRITLPELFSFLSRLSIGSYLVLIGFGGALFYFGIFIDQLLKGSHNTRPAALENRIEQLQKELSVSKLDVQRQFLELDQLKNEKLDLLGRIQAARNHYQLLWDSREVDLAEALSIKGQMETKIRGLEQSLSMQRQQAKQQENELILAQRKNVELSTALDTKNQTIITLLEEKTDLELRLVNRRFQRDFSNRLQKVAYILWAPESDSLPPVYIDNKHYALFKCLRKLLPGDLLDKKEDDGYSFLTRFDKTALLNVPHLFIIPIPQGEHKITRHVSSDGRRAYDFTGLLQANQVHFVDIDQVDVVRQYQGAQSKLTSLDQSQLVKAIPIKIFDSMLEDTTCLFEQALGGH